MNKTKRICPRCGNEYTDYPALSRIDNVTEICPECGMTEALEVAGLMQTGRKNGGEKMKRAIVIDNDPPETGEVYKHEVRLETVKDVIKWLSRFDEDTEIFLRHPGHDFSFGSVYTKSFREIEE